MRILITLTTTLVFNTAIVAQSYFPIKVNKKWGLMDEYGDIFIQPSYDAIGEFQRFGYAIMQRSGKVGLLNRHGKEIVLPHYGDIQVLDSTLIAVMDTDEWMVINLSGEIILEKGYERAKVWGGEYIAFRKNHRWGLADKFGEIICPAKYGGLKMLDQGFFQTREADQFGLMDKNGKEILPCQYDEIRIYNEQVFFYRKARKWGATDEKGRKLIDMTFDNFQSVSSEFIKLFRNQKTYLYSLPAQKIISKTQYDAYYSFNADWVLCKKDRKLGLMDPFGQLSLPVCYEEIQDCGAGLFRVKYLDKWGVVDRFNKTIIAFQYDYISPLNHQMCMAKKSEAFGLINFKGEVLIPIAYDRIELEGELAKAYQGDRLKLFYFDASGQLKDQQEFNNHFSIAIAGKTKLPVAVATTENDLPMKDFEWFYASSLDKWGLRRLDNGEEQIKPSFDYIKPMLKYGLTLVGIEKFNTIDFDRTSFRFDMVYGIVNNEVGKLVTNVDLLDVRFEDFEKDYPVARIVFESGRHGLVSRDPIGKILHKDFAYIGNFKNGLARISIKGQLSGSLQAKGKSLGMLNDYLNNIISTNYRIDYTLHDQFFAKDAALTCADCSFGYIDTLGKITVPCSYSFARDFVNGFGIVEKDGKWGGLSTKNENLLACQYDGIEFLENTSNQILKLFQHQKKYGLIDTLGRLSVKLLYEEIAAFSENRLAVKKNGLWGFVDQNGREVIPCKYKAIRNFSEGYAAVKLSRKWGVIDRNGRVKIDFKYTRVGDMQDGLIWVQKSARVAYLNAKGKTVISGDFERATNFSGGVARVYQDGKYGLIDLKGAYILKPKYSHIAEFNQHGLARVRYGKERIRYGLINREGDLITRQQFKKIRNFKEGRAAVKYREAYGFIDTTGHLQIANLYSQVGDFSEGRARVQRDGKCGYVDMEGNEVVDLAYTKCLDFEDGKAVVYKGYRKGGIIDLEGRFIIEPAVNRLLDFSDGRGLVRNPNYEFYYITDEAKRHQTTNYQKAGKFKHGVAAVQMNNRWGIINQKGIRLIPPKFDKIEAFENGFAKVSMERFSGLSNLKGDIIVAPNFEYISYAGKGLFRVEQGDKIGYFDISGKWIWGLKE